MRKGLFFAIPLTLISLNSFGIDFGVIRQITDINKQNFNQPDVSCVQNLVSPFSHGRANKIEYNECALALCGTPANNPSAWLTDANVSSGLSSDVKKQLTDLTPTIKNILKKSKQENLKELDDLKKLSENINNLDPSKFSPTFSDELNSLVFAPFFKEELVPNAKLGERLNYKIINTEGLSPDFLSSLKSYTESLKKQSSLNYYSYKDKNIYSPDELRQLAKKSLEETIKSVNKTRKNFNDYELKYIDESLAKAKLEIENLSDSKSLDGFYGNLDYIDGTLALKHPDQTFRISSAKCTGNSCKSTYIDFLKKQNIEQGIEKLKQDLNNPDKEASAINRCKAAIATASLVEANNAKAKEVFEAAKKAIIQNTLPRFSEHSRKILNDYLKNKLKFQPVNIRAKVTGSGKNVFDNFKLNANAYLKDNGNDIITFDDQENNLRKAILINSNLSTIDPFSNSTSPCPPDITSNAWDSFLPISVMKKKNILPDELKKIGIEDQIFISDFSCTHDSRGKHAIAHEIGHALNSVFANTKLSTESAKLYKSIRGCATNNYFNAQKDSTFFTQEGDSVYTEEDTADLFAFMSFPKEKTIFTCSLLKPNYSNQGYSELDFISEDGDSHSTSFARVIIEAINKGVELPVSCQRIINQDKPQMSMKKCI